MNWGRWEPYVPVAQRRARGNAQAKKKLRKGEAVAPVLISGRKIATTFWGKAWCDHFDQYSDFSNRLPRGRTYARNGSIAHLRIESGKATAYVSGSSLYEVKITIKPLAKKAWKDLCASCATSIHSVIDLMRGRLPEPVIKTLTDPDVGMFPTGRDLQMSCSCPDGAYMCKHLAATIYGVGNRLDESPELLFLLRGVDQHDLIGMALATEVSPNATDAASDNELAGEDLADIFGIELATDAASPPRSTRQERKSPGKKATKQQKATEQRAAKKKAGKKKAEKKKAAKKETAKKKASAHEPSTTKETKKTTTRKTKKKVTASESTKKGPLNRKSVKSTAKPTAKKRSTSV